MLRASHLKFQPNTEVWGCQFGAARLSRPKTFREAHRARTCSGSEKLKRSAPTGQESLNLPPVRFGFVLGFVFFTV